APGARRLVPDPDRPRRRAGHDRARRDVPRDHAVRAHDGELADRHARHDDHVLPQPGAAADAHGRDGRDALVLVGHLGGGRGVRAVGDEHVGGEHHVVLDHDLLERDHLERGRGRDPVADQDPRLEPLLHVLPARMGHPPAPVARVRLPLAARSQLHARPDMDPFGTDDAARSLHHEPRTHAREGGQRACVPPARRAAPDVVEPDGDRGEHVAAHPHLRGGAACAQGAAEAKWRPGAPLGSSSYAAIWRPPTVASASLFLMMMPTSPDSSQPSRSTTAWRTALMSTVCWAAPVWPLTVQSGMSVHSTLAPTGGRLESGSASLSCRICAGDVLASAVISRLIASLLSDGTCAAFVARMIDVNWM